MTGIDRNSRCHLCQLSRLQVDNASLKQRDNVIVRKFNDFSGKTKY